VLPRLSATLTVPALFHKTPMTIELPAVVALLKARLLVVPDLTSLARAWTNVGVAAAATCAGAT
jgi:hypothetical protein